MNQNTDKKSSIAAIILAAGASRRMGQPKQLLTYKGQTLLSHVINCSLSSECKLVIVILGANAQKIEPKINHLPIKIVENTYWNQGISSSINCGVTYIQKQYLDIDGVIFLTCDQPFISNKIINQIINAYNFTSQPIIASRYNHSLGIPALFSRSFFSELIKLQSNLTPDLALGDLQKHTPVDRGAKKIINKYSDLVYQIDFPLGEIDLDTLKDYQDLIANKLC